MSERRMPKELKDRVLYKSKRSKVGQIVVKDFTGIVPSNAKRVIKKFEALTGSSGSTGHEDIVEKLEAREEKLTKSAKRLLELMKRPHRKSLAHLIAQAGASPTEILTQYSYGAIELAKVEALRAAAEAAPEVLRDLKAHALDKTGACRTCFGTGEVPMRAVGTRDIKVQRKQIPCLECSGSGKSLISSALKEFAVDKILEVNKMTGKGADGPMVQVNQGVQINQGGAPGGFMERVLESTDKILYSRARQTDAAPEDSGEIIDAEATKVTPDVSF